MREPGQQHCLHQLNYSQHHQSIKKIHLCRMFEGPCNLKKTTFSALLACVGEYMQAWMNLKADVIDAFSLGITSSCSGLWWLCGFADVTSFKLHSYIIWVRVKTNKQAHSRTCTHGSFWHYYIQLPNCANI
jgi:hypothetical protein